MSGFLVVAPVLVPLAFALITALAHGRPQRVANLSLAGAFALLACTLALLVRVVRDGVQRSAFGGWDAPFGIEFVVDPLSASMAVITALMGVAALVFQRSSADPAPEGPTLHPLVHALLAGVGGAFVTGDLFNLYVWFEVMLLASLGLLALGMARRHLEATLKYFVLNAVGTLLLLIGVASVYAMTGHVNYDALLSASGGIEPMRLLPVVALLCLAFLIKGGAFPVFAWLPASYHTLPAPLLALFAGLLTKVGVYAVLRMLADVFVAVPDVAYQALGWIAVATMITGVLGAAYHWDMRRILSFHIVSQIGYMLLGIALDSTQGTVGTVFYILHHIVVKANLFLIAAIVFALTGSYDLRRAGGLWKARPWLGVLFLIPALSLVGIPPLSGFWAKYIVVREALTQGQVVWAASALLVGFLTMYSMMKIWMQAFWAKHPDDAWTPPADVRLGPAWVVTVGLAAITLVIGLMPQPLYVFAEEAARVMGAGS
ncbi:proton-conducting transporter membrane subunit [Luteimonas abyssi]|uniref:proton-conducting transporter transmembrane domain-containing protein n=1 Tax=Luteimonas abyssi TaxID=1247514 RepID=UPI000737B256|nr:proton-conducting transporter membrane subunit [Luteimonas abyssi]